MGIVLGDTRAKKGQFGGLFLLLLFGVGGGGRSAVGWVGTREPVLARGKFGRNGMYLRGELPWVQGWGGNIRWVTHHDRPLVYRCPVAE